MDLSSYAQPAPQNNNSGPTCACGTQVKSIECQKGNNAGKWFQVCANANREKTTGCSYWSWVGEQPKYEAKPYGVQRGVKRVAHGQSTAVSGQGAGELLLALRDVLAALKRQTEVQERIEMHLRALVPDAEGGDAGNSQNYVPH